MPNTAEPPTPLLTLGQLASRLRGDGVEVTDCQLKYAITTYRIEPAGRIGILRVWTAAAIPLIKSVLQRIASNRNGSGF